MPLTWNAAVTHHADRRTKRNRRDLAKPELTRIGSRPSHRLLPSAHASSPSGEKCGGSSAGSVGCDRRVRDVKRGERVHGVGDECEGGDDGG
jgi:hypothetical protein